MDIYFTISIKLLAKPCTYMAGTQNQQLDPTVLVTS